MSACLTLVFYAGEVGLLFTRRSLRHYAAWLTPPSQPGFLTSCHLAVASDTLLTQHSTIKENSP